MNKFFFSRLALSNLRRNRQIFAPYLITSALAVAMLYMLVFLADQEGLSKALRGYLNLGVWVEAVFSAVFVFYTSSFLVKKRKKEMGLYSVLGMRKGHILRVFATETVFSALFSIAAGLLLGVLASKLGFALLAKLIGYSIPLGFFVSLKGLILTAGIFFFIFLAVLLLTAAAVMKNRPAELLTGAEAGEKEPKAKWLIAAAGAFCLGGGYLISLLTSNSSRDVLPRLFLSVLLVIAGTYLCFISGSIALLKIMKKKSGYYYKTRHFLSVSGMMYRMKKNGAGLANICLLCTMALVMLSTTVSMNLGIEDSLRSEYKRNIQVEWLEPDEEAEAYMQTLFETEQDPVMYHYLVVHTTYLGRDARVQMIDLADFNKTYGTDYALGQDELLLYKKGGYQEAELALFNKSYRVTAIPSLDGRNVGPLFEEEFLFLVTPDMEALYADYEESDKMTVNGQTSVYDYQRMLYLGFDTPLTGEAQIEYATTIREKVIGYVNCEAYYRGYMMNFCGGFLFIAIFLSGLFMTAAAFILYYKQVFEGYEDRERFSILTRVGLSKEEARGAVNAQMKWVFFLPLLASMVHIAFAFKQINRVLAVWMSLSNTPLFLLCTLGCILFYAVFYYAVYAWSRKSYRKLVGA